LVAMVTAMLVKYFAFVIPRILAVKRNRMLFEF